MLKYRLDDYSAGWNIRVTSKKKITQAIQKWWKGSPNLWRWIDCIPVKSKPLGELYNVEETESVLHKCENECRFALLFYWYYESRCTLTIYGMFLWKKDKYKKLLLLRGIRRSDLTDQPFYTHTEIQTHFPWMLGRTCNLSTGWYVDEMPIGHVRLNIDVSWRLKLLMEVEVMYDFIFGIESNEQMRHICFRSLDQYTSLQTLLFWKKDEKDIKSNDECSRYVFERISFRNPSFRKIVERGERVLLEYKLRWVFSTEDDWINYGPVPKDEFILVSDLDVESFRFVLQQFSKDFPNSPRPTVGLWVPFETVLDLISECSVLLSRGKAFIHYRHAEHWISGVWRNRIERQKKDDFTFTQEVYIFQHEEKWGKLMEKRCKAMKKMLDETWMDRKERQDNFFTDCVIPFWHNHTYESSMHMSYLPYFPDDNEKRYTYDSIQYQLFSTTITMWLKHRSRYTRDQCQPHHGDTFDAGKALPPCLSIRFNEALEKGQHFKDSDRVDFFKFLAHIGISLAEAQRVWFGICAGDSSLANETRNFEHFKTRTSIGRYPTTIYTSMEKHNFPHPGCSTLKERGQCVFSSKKEAYHTITSTMNLTETNAEDIEDIEDICEQKSNSKLRNCSDLLPCQKTCVEYMRQKFNARVSRWPYKKWSPSVAWDSVKRLM